MKLKKRYKKIIFISDTEGDYDYIMKIIKKYPYYKIVLCGDFIDRGKDSKKVLDLILKGRVWAIKGNHEDFFYDFYVNACSQYSRTSWLVQGGYETILSFLKNKNEIKEFNFLYDSFFEIKSDDNFKKLRKFVRSKIDTKYLDLIKNLPLYLETDDFICSHAPLVENPKNIKTKEEEEDFLWNRKDPIKIFDKIQIFGHQAEEDFVLFYGKEEKPHSICLDTNGGEFKTLLDFNTLTVYQWDEAQNEYFCSIAA